MPLKRFINLKSMVAKAFACLFALAVCSAGCSHKAAPVGRYQSTPVTADGIPDEWALPLRFANATRTLQYNVTNDNGNIYICAMSHDERTILRMLRSGMTVYFDPKGQAGRDISLHYPLRKQPDPNIRDRKGETQVSHRDSGWMEELVKQSDSYGITGFSGLENGQFPVSGNQGPIRVAIKLSRHDSLLVFEAVVPIRNVLGSPPELRNPKRSFSIGIVLNTPSGQTVMNEAHHSAKALHHHRTYDTAPPDSPPIREDANWYQFRLAPAGQKS